MYIKLFILLFKKLHYRHKFSYIVLLAILKMLILITFKVILTHNLKTKTTKQPETADSCSSLLAPPVQFYSPGPVTLLPSISAALQWSLEWYYIVDAPATILFLLIILRIYWLTVVVLQVY